jgi:hypothetical protein
VQLSTVFLHQHPIRGDVAVFFEFSLCLALYFSTRLQGEAVLAGLASTAAAIACHLLSLVVSTVLYRLSPFHPLAKFPGPVLNKMTSLKLVYNVSTGKCPLITDELHKKYGKFVRTGQ